MDIAKIGHFLLNHWFLSSLFILLLIMVFVEEARSKGLGSSGVTPQKLTQLINRDNAIVVDIRENNAFKDGHILGAINLPQASMDQNLNKINKHKSQTLVVVDGSGQKAMATALKLKKAGFEKVQVLTGGLNAWKSAGLPTTTK